MIKHTTWMYLTNNSENYRPFLNDILSSYNWENGSMVHLNGNYYFQDVYGTYYFTHNSYIKIYNQNDHFFLKIDIVTPSQSKTVLSAHDMYWTASIGKTSKGICICAYSGSTVSSRDPYFYNLYIGEITKLDGTVTKGCIYADDNGTLTIATDDGISSEKAQTSTINADRTAILAPVVDTTYGNVFKDIYFMRSSPLNCNIMAVEGQGNFLCGKTLCLKDQEVEA